MTEEEQEKLYELLFKDTKNKLETTIENLRIANAELRDELDKKNSEIEKLEKEKDIYYYEWKHLEANMITKINELKEKNASLQKEIKLMKSININDNYISKDKIRDKIKEYQNKLFQDVEENKVVEYENIIQVLEELLGEKDERKGIL